MSHEKYYGKPALPRGLRPATSRTEEERSGQQRSGRVRGDSYRVPLIVPWCGVRSSSVRGADGADSWGGNAFERRGDRRANPPLC